MERTRSAQARATGPAPLPRAHLDEILEFYHQRALEGEPLAEIRAQSRFFRPEVRRLLDRELDRLARARTKR
jgi:hypothetical protein